MYGTEKRGWRIDSELTFWEKKESERETGAERMGPLGKNSKKKTKGLRAMGGRRRETSGFEELEEGGFRQ